MCQITIYRDRKTEESMVMGEVFSYEIDLENNTLTASPIIGRQRKFKLGDVEKITWSESDDSLVILGGIEEILK